MMGQSIVWKIHLKYPVGELRERLAAEFSKPHRGYSGWYRVTMKPHDPGYQIVIRLSGVWAEIGLIGHLERQADKPSTLTLTPYTALRTKIHYLSAPVSFFLVSLLFAIGDVRYRPVFLGACIFAPIFTYFYLLKIKMLHEIILEKVKNAVS